jgi:TatD DNase family protein
MGFCFGIDGNLTYEVGLQNVVKNIPLERILLETDAPDLSPIPHRGLKNTPKNVKITAQFLADLKGLSLEEVTKTTFENTARLFKI